MIGSVTGFMPVALKAVRIGAIIVCMSATALLKVALVILGALVTGSAKTRAGSLTPAAAATTMLDMGLMLAVPVPMATENMVMLVPPVVPSALRMNGGVMPETLKAKLPSGLSFKGEPAAAVPFASTMGLVVILTL
ncbi:hypothetical protein [Geotalea uraniireducens]|uniref:hypothetical protein n=1 Tax=Geotalea uraniireducens TaxID=351604 RepID=UPI00059B8F93|nr:hypothetical protein [Geotalea uraniireducens]